ncbi:iron uptake system protein EfeO [Modestobacter sp. I12A-02628]|uniref:Iron uptake system protein EfeO n=1 Tax=Goekera deserti TaxID=2497753 RepID=A0A7K3WFE6_9ACTN|nr:iron uptake system protein EfeO [Goekera deserti]MPR00067.1 iron uptake system protein EfeO [Goekera deserti]NDI49846.1 iron uptake system protein EfeO [Goekera deserti]NEL55208.1 iron uptake system protein EfeO [Goekera deserti]
MSTHLRSSRAVLAALSLTGVTLLAACGSDGSGDTSSAAADDIAVAASDDSCDVATTDLQAGTHQFTVTNSGSKVTEFYVYAEGDRVMAEVENIAPGVARDLLVELPAGSYETACKPGMVGDGIRSVLTVSGESQTLSEDETLSQASADYQRYVQSQTGALLEQTTAFADAVKAGDIEGAKTLYPVARTYWERIEPVAEIFGDLDPIIDGREGDQAPGEDFTGYHRIEKALWEAGDVSDMGPYADRLVSDVQQIVDLANEETLDPLQLANGAKALLDEIATGKITGEEDRYSHTDLWDFKANLDGSQAAVQALRPYLEEADPELVGKIDERFAATQAELAQYQVGDGWTLYDQLSEEQLRGLSDSITALTESVSQVAAVVAQR